MKFLQLIVIGFPLIHSIAAEKDVASRETKADEEARCRNNKIITKYEISPPVKFMSKEFVLQTVFNPKDIGGVEHKMYIINDKSISFAAAFSTACKEVLGTPHMLCDKAAPYFEFAKQNSDLLIKTAYERAEVIDDILASAYHNLTSSQLYVLDKNTNKILHNQAVLSRIQKVIFLRYVVEEARSLIETFKDQEFMSGLSLIRILNLHEGSFRRMEYYLSYANQPLPFQQLHLEEEKTFADINNAIQRAINDIDKSKLAVAIETRALAAEKQVEVAKSYFVWIFAGLYAANEFSEASYALIEYNALRIYKIFSLVVQHGCMAIVMFSLQLFLFRKFILRPNPDFVEISKSVGAYLLVCLGLKILMGWVFAQIQFD